MLIVTFWGNTDIHSVKELLTSVSTRYDNWTIFFFYCQNGLITWNIFWRVFYLRIHWLKLPHKTIRCLRYYTINYFPFLNCFFTSLLNCFRAYRAKFTSDDRASSKNTLYKLKSNFICIHQRAIQYRRSQFKLNWL